MFTDDGRAYYFNEAQQITQWERPVAVAVEAGVAEGAPVAAADEGVLPVGWVEMFTDDGRAYYFNEAQQITQWDRPVAAADEAVVDALPVGWVEMTTEDGRSYYFNEAEQITQWERPAAAAAPATEAAATEAAALPDGWVEMFTEDGRAYYFNEAGQVTQWDRPTA
jgi:hypothetical protein